MSNVTVFSLWILAEKIKQAEETGSRMRVALQVIREVLDGTCGWLVYPCRKGALSCRMSRIVRGRETGEELQLPVDRHLADLLGRMSREEEPQSIDGIPPVPCPEQCGQTTETCSLLMVCLHLNNDQPWLLGICSEQGRTWTKEERVFLQLAAERLTYACDTPKFLETMQRDIVKRQLMETERVRSERRFQSLFEHTSLALWMLDISGLRERVRKMDQGEIELDERIPLADLLKTIRVVAVNQATLDLFGVSSRAEFYAALPGLIDDGPGGISRSILSALGRGEHHLTVEGRVHDVQGNRVTVIVHLDLLPVPDDHLALLSISDITERKEAEERLMASMERYRLLMENAADGILLANAVDGAIIEANPRAEAMTGLSRPVLLQRKIDDLAPAGERESWIRLLHAAGEIDPYQEGWESVLRREDGRLVPVEIRTSRTAGSGKGIVQFIFHDISGRLAQENQRRLLATVVEQSAESVMITDPDGTIRYVNPAYERVTGYEWQEVVGKKPSLLKSGQEPEYKYRLLWQKITSGKVWQGKLVNRKKDGSLFTEALTIAPVMDHHGEIRHFVAVKRDITRQEELEKLVRQAQKMQAIGTLAGGIAHDFNNILTAILGFAELSTLQCGENTVLRANLEEIITASERAGKLIDQILTFSRQTEKHVTTMQMGPIVKEVLKLLRASLPANIEVSVDIRSDGWVRADPTQVHQVVMNLCTNAYQALGRRENGWIRVCLDRQEIDPGEGIQLGRLNAGPFIVLQVEDNGHGIPEEYLERIFEPYFTTREKNEGTGLGLSVVHGIVNDHGGAVTVTSTAGRGSVFTVYLPEVNERDRAEAHELGTLARGKGKILLVDDERPIVDFEAQALEEAGYRVVATDSSAEALQLFLREQDTLDLVVTDMAMPGMTGVQLFREVRKHRPELPVLLCTGYSEYVTRESSQEMGIDGYLAKPFTAEQLAAEVYRILNP